MERPFARRRFTRTEYHRMGRTGILREDDRTELIDGEIITMPPMGHDHRDIVIALTRLFVKRLNGLAVVGPALPVALSEYDEPQPDFQIVRPAPDRYRGRDIEPEHVIALVEVSHSTIRFDRGKKRRRYARFGIRETWIVDVEKRRVEVYRHLRDGEYQSVRIANRGERLAFEALPAIEFTVDEIVGEDG